MPSTQQSSPLNNPNHKRGWFDLNHLAWIYPYTPQPQLSVDTQLQTMLALVKHADKDGWCCPGIPKLASLTRRSERTIKRCTALFKSLGFLSNKRRFNNSNGYTINRGPIVRAIAMAYLAVFFGLWTGHLGHLPSVSGHTASLMGHLDGLLTASIELPEKELPVEESFSFSSSSTTRERRHKPKEQGTKSEGQPEDNLRSGHSYGPTDGYDDWCNKKVAAAQRRAEVDAHKFQWRGEQVSVGDFTIEQLQNIPQEYGWSLGDLIEDLRSGETSFAEFDKEVAEYEDEWASGRLAERVDKEKKAHADFIASRAVA